MNGIGLGPASPSVPLAYVETNVPQGSTVMLTGTGFNDPQVNLFTASGNAGPLTPLPGGTATQIQVVVPGDAPSGPGSFQVVNSPFSGNVQSQSVSVPIGDPLDVTGVSQSDSVVTVDGAGFSTLSVINLFNDQGGGNVVNLGGLDSDGSPRIPLTFVSENQLTFAVPAGAVTGPAFVEVLNPPFIPSSSTSDDPDGGFLVTN